MNKDDKKRLAEIRRANRKLRRSIGKEVDTWEQTFLLRVIKELSAHAGGE